MFILWLFSALIVTILILATKNTQHSLEENLSITTILCSSAIATNDKRNA